MGHADKKYRYALDATGRAVHVYALTQKSTRQGYVCAGCDRPMLAKLGDERTWYFAHKPGDADGGDCSEESYLHIMAKNLFLFRFKECLREKKPFPYERTYPRVCRRQGFDCPAGHVRCIDDLTKVYNAISMEKRWERFVPDLTLRQTSGAKKCFVEIRVSSAVSREKAASGVPIIEITVASERDLVKISEGVIEAEMAQEYKLGKRPVVIDPAGCPCLVKAEERQPNSLRTEADFERLQRRTDEVIARMRRMGRSSP